MKDDANEVGDMVRDQQCGEGKMVEIRDGSKVLFVIIFSTTTRCNPHVEPKTASPKGAD